MTNIWFTSDLHYWHKNITFGESVWDNKEINCRKFSTTSEMSRHIVSQINKYVGQDDLLYDLGDWSFGGQQNIWNLRKQLIVNKIIHINGNHDETIRKNKIELPNCRRIEPYSSHIIDGKPIGGEYPDYVLPQDLFTEVHEILTLTLDKISIIMSHYPFQEWREDIHLHGHVHGKYHDNQFKGRLDVGIDSAFKYFGEYRPFSWEDIKQILKIK